MAGMLRSLSVICGLAAGSVITVKTLNYLDLHEKNLKAISSFIKPSSLENCFQDTEVELVLVQVLFRHGARTPLKLIPGIEETVWDKNKLLYELPDTKLNYHVKDLKNRVLPPEETLTDVLRGGCRKGQLTVVGQQQTYDLGRNLKRLYKDQLNFIEDTFDSKTIFLRTTNIPRTIHSLRCLVSGMFHNISEPITFWTLPIKEEFLFPNWNTCAALKQYMRYCFKNGHKLEGYQDDLNKFFDMIGGHVHGLNFIDIFDDLSCREAHNKPYPEKLNRYMNTVEKRSVQQLSEALLSSPSWTKNLVLPLSTGRMLQHIYNNMKKKAVNKNPYKLYLFSVHDASIISFFCSLGLKLDSWPPFASYIAVELYKNKVIKLKNYDQTLMPLSQFEKLVCRYFVDDVESACRTTLHPPDS